MRRGMLLKPFHLIIDGAFSCLAPPRCRSCRAPLLGHDNPYLCPACAAAVEWIGDGACRGCGFPAGPHAAHAENCLRCRDKKLNLTAAVAVARYRHGARNLVRSFKYGGETELARPLAALMAERLRAADFFSGVDMVVPVALHPKRRRERGFDQARMLAEPVATLVGLPCRPGVVKRVRHTTPQAALHRAQRLENMKGAFTADESLKGRRVVLVDDVMTTGATMADCARACREAGATRMYALLFAR